MKVTYNGPEYERIIKDAQLSNFDEIEILDAHKCDRRLDYILNYWRRRTPIKIILHSKFEDSHPLLDNYELHLYETEKVKPPTTKQELIKYFANGIDPRLWSKDFGEKREVLKHWKYVNWIGHPIQMRQIIPFLLVLTEYN